MNIPKRAPYVKYTTEELMEMIDIFNVSQDGQKQIRAVLDSEKTKPDAGNFFRYYNSKSKVVEFEKQFADKIGSKHVLAVNSGTSALIAALVAAGVGPGDEVIVPGYTFFASVSAIVVAKGIPVITEINETMTLDPAAFEKNITRKTKAVIVVHMLGMPAKMDEICAIAKKHNIVVIEDVAQACGAKYKGKYLGTWGDLGCVSLDAYKVIGSGEGGIVMTNDEWLYTRAQSWHDTAACWRPDRYGKERREGELFCGENYRMSEPEGAVALAQLRKLDSINKNTRAIYTQLKKEIKLPKGVKWVDTNDEDGVCGYMIGLLFETPEDAEKAMNAGLGIGGLAAKTTKGARDWHVYWFWEHIMKMKTATTEGCPYKCQHVKQIPDYNENMCPKTKDIMLRFGVMGISPADTPEWASAQAKHITDELAKLF